MDAQQSEGSLSCYKPLPSQTSFRVLELLPDDEDSKIRYKLHFADWNKSPQYEAISYAWKNTGLRISTVCDGKALGITTSLHEGLPSNRHLTLSLGRCRLHLFLSNCNETPRKLKVYASVFRGVSFCLGAEKLMFCTFKIYITNTPICTLFITIFV
jgi:hypothetical protein